MSDIPGLKSDVHFGAVDAALPDWRSESIADDEDPDDGVLRPTPPEVIAMLGFDPLEFEEADDQSADE